MFYGYDIFTSSAINFIDRIFPINGYGITGAFCIILIHAIYTIAMGVDIIYHSFCAYGIITGSAKYIIYSVAAKYMIIPLFADQSICIGSFIFKFLRVRIQIIRSSWAY